MNYMVFDLEFNQVFTFGREHKKSPNPRCPFEIIHIGAVKLDKNLKKTGTFDRLIKPRIYTRMHPVVKKITGISREDLRGAEHFETVYEELVKFMSDVDVLCVFGTSDIKELLRNIEFYKLDTSQVPKKYIDVQHYVNIHLKRSKGTSIALSKAAEALDIPLGLKLHNAFNDAFYTAEVFKKIYNRHIEPEVYKERTAGKEEKTRPILDTQRLFRQFEKMLHRKITPEEQSIIKLAYKMGSTNQFEK